MGKYFNADEITDYLEAWLEPGPGTVLFVDAAGWYTSHLFANFCASKGWELKIFSKEAAFKDYGGKIPKNCTVPSFMVESLWG